MLVKYTCSKFCSCKEGGGCSLAVTMFKPIVYKPPRGIPVIFTGPSPPVRAEDVDRTLRQQDSGVESALSYAKAWSKYTKELLAWVEKRLNVGEFCTGGGSRSFYTDVQKSAVRSCVTNHVFKYFIAFCCGLSCWEFTQMFLCTVYVMNICLLRVYKSTTHYIKTVSCKTGCCEMWRRNTTQTSKCDEVPLWQNLAQHLAASSYLITHSMIFLTESLMTCFS